MDECIIVHYIIRQARWLKLASGSGYDGRENTFTGGCFAVKLKKNLGRSYEGQFCSTTDMM
jgi:hypothetical protein